MSYLNIYGTGGVVFQDLINVGEYLYFPTAIANIRKKRVYKQHKQNRGKTNQKHKGWRLYHDIKILNYCDDDYINIQKLLRSISYMTNQSGLDKTIYYYPKVDDFYEGFDRDYKSYRVVSDRMRIRFEKISGSIMFGEVLKITFTSYGLDSKLLINASVENQTLVDHKGDNLVSSSGYRFISYKED